ncbi:TPA: restriction endonuclease subunit S [Acinetobacter nosocomialis]|uniref:restriction endonuclease subunit S n=1 Tax=Acinetobacter calcoaceticus/baumannii complex TaxID=909768 RepID=UPI0004619458|nr:MULTISPECIES: restriction endonuclease subunit S [Acinetobacter calcoaceticus/baumannii complex]KCX94000.1 type I restriction modification DNA specificity domain protein [Acinetobacter baumannii 6112]ELT4631133.1 restriction endonuclease subunit S [Acinetobacter baumannii]MBP1463096.1 restriction endonuclease subunit S [Acinetobacter nosocomialis]MBP1497640.1 restriction endonuclease subunit S [Acinetobacter nosocomialis]MBW3007547.1 restriction endonuclease subunit S [Acinetobacter baumann
MSYPMIEIGDLMLKRNGSVDPSKFPDETFELHSIPAFDKGTPDIVKGSEIGSSKQLVQENDVMISKIVPHIRRASVVCPKGDYRQIASGEWIIFRSDKIYPDYLKHVLISDTFNKQFMATVSGVGGSLLRARPAFVAKIKIALPPLAEQRRIASILDQADELRQKRQQAIEKLDQLLQATFIDMFGDPVSNSKGWEVLKWRDALKIINGKNQKAVLDQNGIFPICGSGGVMGYANEWLTPAKSVIIGRKGNINKPILMFENFWNVDTAFGLVPNKDVLNADYLFWFCHFFNFEQLNKTVTIPSLTKSDLLNIDIPTPPLDKQLCFSNICDQTRILKSKMELKDLNLFSSLQNQAFNGTL